MVFSSISESLTQMMSPCMHYRKKGFFFFECAKLFDHHQKEVILNCFLIIWSFFCAFLLPFCCIYQGLPLSFSRSASFAGEAPNNILLATTPCMQDICYNSNQEYYGYLMMHCKYSIGLIYLLNIESSRLWKQSPKERWWEPVVPKWVHQDRHWKSWEY